MQADAYSGYDGLYLNSSGIHAIREVACWAHVRRYWYNARTTDPASAHHVLRVIARLYQLEQRCAQATYGQRAALRQEQALPLLTRLKSWLDEQALRLLPKSPIGQACAYTRNQWEALVGYTEDGALAIDNNAAERAMEVRALERKNWLFVASKTGGQRAAILLSLVASAKANQVEPFAWLRDLFATLPTLSPDSLLPDRWLARHPAHRWRMDELRQLERARSQKLRQRKRR